MASLTIRKIEESTKTALKLRAVKNGRSMEEELRSLISDAVRVQPGTGAELYAELRKIVDELGPLDIEIPKREKALPNPPDFSGWPES